MVERNPYETNEPVDVPNFMSSDKKDDVDMSVFKLDEDEFEEEEEPRKIKKEYLIAGIVGAIVVILLIVLVGLNISKAKSLKELDAKYQTLETTTSTQISKLKTEIEGLTAENTTLKEENEKLKKEAEANSSSSSSSVQTGGGTTGAKANGTIEAGNYKISVGMYVRTSPDGSKIDRASATQAIKEITNDNGTIVEGTTVKVSEVKTVDNNVWGKIADGCWICLRYDGTNYYE